MKQPTNASESVKRLNPELYKPQMIDTTTPTQRNRPSQLEEEFFQTCLVSLTGAHVDRQFRVRVSDWDACVLVHYTADFAVWRKHAKENAWMCDLIEVKDPRRKPHSDELVRPKMVRENNPWINSVTLATKAPDGWNLRKLA